MVPFMPASALRHVEVDHVANIADMAPLLARLTHEPAGPTPEIPLDIRLETAIAAQELADMEIDEQLGQPSRFTCPECHGTLWEIDDGTLLRYRCHVGHAFTADAVLAAQSAEVDRMLSTLLRSHQERAALARRMAEQERAQNRHALADQLAARASEYEDDAKLVRQLFLSGNGAGGAAADEGEGSVHEDGGEEQQV
jgi:two-component system chemotaxis response regulator CheB